MNPEIPTDFPAGYQALEDNSDTLIEDGDILTVDNSRCWANAAVGKPVSWWTQNPGEHVYRKMPLPKQTGDEAYTALDLEQKPTLGQQLGEELRQECNELTPEQRAEAFNHAMQVIDEANLQKQQKEGLYIDTARIGDEEFADSAARIFETRKTLLARLADTDKQEKAKTFDDGKPPLAQLPWAAIRELSMVQLYGAIKYRDYNNYRKGMEISRNLSCAIRHISEFMDGIDNDSESGRSHLGHALCRLAFVLQNIADNVAIDDRYKKLP